MTRFNLDAVVDEETRARFEFDAGGRVFSLPHVSDLMLGQQYQLDAGQVVPVVRAVATFAPDDPGDPKDKRNPGDLLAAILLERKARENAPLIANWLAHAGHQPGESGASST